MGTVKEQETTKDARGASELKRLLGTRPTLHLTLKKRPFEVMVTGEKVLEIRERSDWIESRLIGRDYDFVKFVNGYGADRPLFVAEYNFWFRAEMFETKKYSNGLKVAVRPGDCIISLGEVIYTENLEALT